MTAILTVIKYEIVTKLTQKIVSGGHLWSTNSERPDFHHCHSR